MAEEVTSTTPSEAQAETSEEQTASTTNSKQNDGNSAVISPLEEKVIRQIEVCVCACTTWY